MREIEDVDTETLIYYLEVLKEFSDDGFDVGYEIQAVVNRINYLAGLSAE